MEKRKRVATHIYADADERLWLKVEGVNRRPNRPQPISEWIPLDPSASIKDAQSVLVQIRSDLELGRFRVERYDPARPTLAAALEDLLSQRRENRPGTRRWWMQHAALWLDRLGPIEAHRLDHYDVSDWWMRIRDEKTPGVANDGLRTLRATIDHAEHMGWRKYQGNPAKALKLGREPRPFQRPVIELEDWQRIAKWMRWEDGRRIRSAKQSRARAMRWAYTGHYPYALTQVLLAARGSEVCGLERRDINWERRVITLRETKTAPTLERIVSEGLLRVLHEHRENLLAYGTEAAAVSDFVFPSTLGMRTDPTSRFKKTWNRCMADLGYPVGRAKGGWVAHDLRRLGVLQLYEHGADQRVAMEFVGHHVATVHAHYVRALGDRVDEIVTSVAHDLALPPSKRPPKKPAPVDAPDDEKPPSKNKAKR